MNEYSSGFDDTIEYMNVDNMYTEEEKRMPCIQRDIDKFKAQRIEKGYCDADVRELNTTIAVRFALMLRDLKERMIIAPKGRTLDEWKNELEGIAKDFETYTQYDVDVYDGEDENLSDDKKAEIGQQIKHNKLSHAFEWMKDNYGYLYVW